MLLITAWAARSQAAGPPVGPRWAELRQLLKIGLPIGVHLAAEFLIFGTVAILIARLGPTALAANQISMTMADFSFMTASGLGVAGSVRMGQLIGASEPARARRVGLLTLALGAGVMLCFTAAYAIFSGEIVASFVPNNPEVVPLGVCILRVVAFASLPIGGIAIGAGILRGYGDTRWPLAASLVGYWVIGLPVALLLSGPASLGAVGYWGGLTAGMSAVSVALIFRFLRLSAGPVARV